MFYQEDLSTCKSNKKKDIIENYMLNNSNLNLKIDVESFSSESHDLSTESNDNDTFNDNDSESNTEKNYLSDLGDLGSESKFNNKLHLLSKKINELNEKINFINKHNINMSPSTGLNVDMIIENFDLIIGQINMGIIGNGQITPKSTRTVEKKIFQFEF